ncbi:MAG TPA: sugar phosphate isomerase/epimerase [Acidimicrobiales bacterium]|nr:sugar phosphate isomerase/epimerase [Acidimicrobiales bacterium]
MGAATREVLWSAGLAPAPLADRIAAAAANGYRILSITPADHDQARAAGLDPAEVAARAADAGVELAILDGLIEWYPHEPPKRPLGSAMVGVDDVLHAGEAFGTTSLCALAPYPTSIPLEEMAGHFAALCDRAAGQGWRVHFEFTPRSPVSDVATAAELVRLADRPNGGILFDTWHFFRVDGDLGALRHVPGQRIFSVQVSDGAADFQEGLLADTFRHRRLPGTGVFDLVGLLGVLDDIGGLRLVGPEVLSVELFSVPVAEAARRGAESLDAVLARLG